MTYLTRNETLSAWLREVDNLCQPDEVYWCDGSEEEYQRLMALMIEGGSATALKKRSNSFLFRSDPSGVARVEARTYISTPDEGEAGPTNNWIDPDELKKIMKELYSGCMKGRTLYIVPFSMGPIGSPMAKIGVELTDSPYVVCNMHMRRRGDAGTRGYNNAVMRIYGDEGKEGVFRLFSASPRLIS